MQYDTIFRRITSVYTEGRTHKKVCGAFVAAKPVQIRQTPALVAPRSESENICVFRKLVVN